jgi:carbon storage regulator
MTVRGNSEGTAMMLVLQRRIGQSLIVNHRITVTVKGVRGKAVSIGIEAPKEVGIRRSELLLPNNSLPACVRCRFRLSLPTGGSAGEEVTVGSTCQIPILKSPTPLAAPPAASQQLASTACRITRGSWLAPTYACKLPPKSRPMLG